MKPLDQSWRVVMILMFFWLITVAPGLQMAGTFWPEEKLTGAVVEINRPQWSWSVWLSGAWQTNFEQWWNQNLGFRGALIKTVNQINFSVFKEISSGGNVKIVLGKNKMLYEKGYITNYHGRDTVPLSVLEKQVAQLVALQRKLEQKGIVLVVVISPSKARVYPEYLPAAWARKQPATPLTDYERIKPLLAQTSIPLIDSTEFFLTKKSEIPYLLFPEGGTHWSYYSACLVQSEIMRILATQLAKPLRNVDCTPVGVDTQVVGTDRDLSDLLNIWDKTAIVGPTPHPKLAGIGDKNAYAPRVAAIGDSFIWTLAAVAHSARLYAEQDIYYYFESRRRYPALPEPQIRDRLDWEKDFFSKDVIIIETNEVAVNTIGFGFVEAALAQ